MSYQLQSDEEIRDGIVRIAVEQAERAAGELESEEIQIHEAIHQARKRFKKIRAVARLVRDEIGEETYRRDNRKFRDLGRDLAPLRDAQVLVNTAERLKSRYSDVLDDHAYSGLLGRLREQVDQVQTSLLEDQGSLSRVRREVRAALPQIRRWPIEGTGFDVFDGGFRRVCRRGRKGLKKGLSDASAEVLHDWRKRVKYLWYHLRILRPCWPEVLKAWTHQCHRLADLLGDIHDLFELESALSQFDLPNPAHESLLGLSRQWRLELTADSIELGRRLYAERTQSFANRIEAYWGAWR